jgi:hypothetical protein
MCFDRISIGMPYSEAEKILEEYGFVMEGTGGQLKDELTFSFRRAGSHDIIMSWRFDGQVSYKELVMDRGNVHGRNKIAGTQRSCN